MTPSYDCVRNPRARRLALRLDAATGRARLTIPGRLSMAKALAWAEGQRDWLARAQASLPEARPFVDDMILDVADRSLTLSWVPGNRRTIVRDNDRLLASGPIETLPRRVEAWLRREALALLSAETAEFARVAGVPVAAVAVGDARGRWGSCSSAGTIRYSWRLILAPGWVRRATVAHEVAHRLHMDHSPAFHAAVARLLGDDPRLARAWLRAHGASLHWVGRSA